MSARTDSFFIRPKRRGLGVEMAPLIDIVFLLLIFFMLNTSFSSPAIPMALPEAREGNGAIQEAEVTVVSAYADGRVFINREEVTLDDYEEKLASVMELNGDHSVFFKGEKGLDYHRALEIIQRTNAAGGEVFNFVLARSEQEDTGE